MLSAPRVIPVSSKWWIIRSVRSLALEDSAWVVHQHTAQLLVGYALLLQRGNHVVMNVQIVPARQNLGQGPLRQPMVVAGSVVGENHLAGVAVPAHLGHGVDAIFERKDGINSKTIHADVGSVCDQFFQIFEIGSIAGVSDDHAGKINTFLAEDALLVESHASCRVGVRGDGYAGFAMRLCSGAQNSLYIFADTGLIGRAFQDAGFHSGISDAFSDVTHELVDDQLAATQRA